MNDEIERDDPLRARFEKAAGPVPSAGPTLLTELKPQMIRARNRRRAAVASTSLGVIIIAGAAFALRSPGETGLTVEAPVTSETVTTSLPRPTSTTTLVPSSTTLSPASTTLPPASSATAPPSSVSTSTSTTRPPTSTSAPTTSATSSTSSSTSTTIQPPIAPRAFSSRAGTVTVSSAGGGILRVDSVAPLAGWTYTIEHDDRDEVEVRFRRSDPNDEVRLRIQLEDGVLTARED